MPRPLPACLLKAALLGSASLTGCAARFGSGASPHQGRYTVHRAPDVAGPAGCLVTGGTVFEQTSQQPLKVAVVAFNTPLVITDTLGRFRYEAPADTYVVRGGFIGYRRVDIRKLRLRPGERVALTFWVVEDDRPLY